LGEKIKKFDHRPTIKKTRSDRKLGPKRTYHNSTKHYHNITHEPPIENNRTLDTKNTGARHHQLQQKYTTNRKKNSCLKRERSPMSLLKGKSKKGRPREHWGKSGPCTKFERELDEGPTKKNLKFEKVTRFLPTGNTDNT